MESNDKNCCAQCFKMRRSNGTMIVVLEWLIFFVIGRYGGKLDKKSGKLLRRRKSFNSERTFSVKSNETIFLGTMTNGIIITIKMVALVERVNYLALLLAKNIVNTKIWDYFNAASLTET